MSQTITAGQKPFMQDGSPDLPAPSKDAPYRETLRYIARQPILNGSGQLHGYELLFRDNPSALSFYGDGVAATRSVLDNSLLLGLERIAGGHLAFINCTQESLENRLVTVLPPQFTVLELLETLDPTPALLEACHALKKAGFRIALDDFLWQPAWEPYLDLADYIKVDLSATTVLERSEIVRHIGPRRIQRIAERVETQSELALARREGFSLFQGYYFCRPVLLQHHAVPANRLVQIEMLLALQDHPLDTQKVASLVKRDAALTYRLLRMVNSPLYGASTEIRSIHQALVLIGDEMFRRISTVAIASELRGGQSVELLRMAYSRARFCEMAAPMARLNPAEQYLLGMLSLFPAMLRLSMQQLVSSLPLRPALRAALLAEPAPERALLDWLLAYESAQWAQCDAIAQSAGWQTQSWSQLYAEALQWAEASLTLTLQ